MSLESDIGWLFTLLWPTLVSALAWTIAIWVLSTSDDDGSYVSLLTQPPETTPLADAMHIAEFAPRASSGAGLADGQRK